MQSWEPDTCASCKTCLTCFLCILNEEVSLTKELGMVNQTCLSFLYASERGRERGEVGERGFREEEGKGAGGGGFINNSYMMVVWARNSYNIPRKPLCA